MKKRLAAAVGIIVALSTVLLVAHQLHSRGIASKSLHKRDAEVSAMTGKQVAPLIDNHNMLDAVK